MHCEHRLTMVLCIAREYSEGDILFSTMKHSSVTRSEGQEMTRGDRKFSVWASHLRAPWMLRDADARACRLLCDVAAERSVRAASSSDDVASLHCSASMVLLRR